MAGRGVLSPARRPEFRYHRVRVITGRSAPQIARSGVEKNQIIFLAFVLSALLEPSSSETKVRVLRKISSFRKAKSPHAPPHSHQASPAARSRAGYSRVD